MREQLAGPISSKGSRHDLTSLGIDDGCQAVNLRRTRPGERFVRVDAKDLRSNGIGEGLGRGDADAQARERAGTSRDGDKLHVSGAPADLSKSLPDAWGERPGASQVVGKPQISNQLSAIDEGHASDLFGCFDGKDSHASPQ